MPRFPALVGDTAVGARLAFGAVVIGLSAVGLYGRRTVSLGRIYTTGGGLEVSLRWHAIQFKRFHLLLGPDVEALAVYGYARETTSAEASNLLAPAITVRLLAEIGLDLGERISLCLTLGGGYNAIHVTFQAKHKDVSGLSGGYMTLATGLYFTLI
jgi:hypothetical protein